MAPPDDEHDCGWKAYAAAQEQKLAELTDKLAALERRLFEKKSERRLTSKLPPPLPKAKRTPDEARHTRKDNAALRDARVETEVTQLPFGERPCPHCNGTRRRIGTSTSGRRFAAPADASRPLQRLSAWATRRGTRRASSLI